MRRFSSRSLAALALVAALGVVLPVTAEAVSSAPSVDGNTEALQRLGGCIAGGAQGDILLLIDRSGSLKQTDPKGTRVDAAKYLIRQMASFAETTKAKLTVAVAGFDTSYSKESDWMPLNGASVNQAETAVERFRDQNRGVDTDYWNALAGARRDLAERAASGGEHCSTVVWFTDGAYDLDPRGNRSDLERKALGDPKPYLQGGALTTEADARAAVEAGLQDVCRPGGVADQLRSQNIVNIAVGLSTPSSSPDFTKLQAIATGAGGSCGAIVKPAPGAFFLAKDIDSLFFAFDQFATPGRAPVTQSAGICGPEVCPEGTHRFVLDPSIGSAHVLGAHLASDERVMLVSPDGAQMELNRASSEQTASTSGANVAWRWVSDQAVSFDLKRSSDQKWTGQWSLAFLSPSKASGTSRSSLQIFGDLLPVWRDAPKEIRVGDKLTMTLGVGHSDGSIVDPASLTAQTTLSADVFKADGNPVAIVDKLSPQSIGAPQTLDFADSSPGQVRVRLKLVVTTQPWISPSGAVVPGTTLEPQVKDYLLTLLAPATYPAVPGTVDFGHTEKRDPVTTSLPVQGDGCVWLAETSPPVTLPQGVTSATITSSAKDQSTCVSGALPLTIAANDVGNGLLSGRFTVATVGKESGAKPIFVPVTYQLDMSRPANTTLLLGALVGITLLGVAHPPWPHLRREVLHREDPGRLHQGRVRSGVGGQHPVVPHQRCRPAARVAPGQNYSTRIAAVWHSPVARW